MVARKGWAEELAMMLVEERKEGGKLEREFCPATCYCRNHYRESSIASE
jgi:hypothetical protein